MCCFIVYQFLLEGGDQLGHPLGNLNQNLGRIYANAPDLFQKKEAQKFRRRQRFQFPRKFSNCSPLAGATHPPCPLPGGKGVF